MTNSSFPTCFGISLLVCGKTLRQVQDDNKCLDIYGTLHQVILYVIIDTSNWLLDSNVLGHRGHG